MHYNSRAFEPFLQDSTDGAYLTAEQLAAFRALRTRECRERNPTAFTFPLRHQVLAFGEASLLLHLVSDVSGKMRVDWLKAFFRTERLPAHWLPPLKGVSLKAVMKTAAWLKWKGGLFS